MDGVAHVVKGPDASGYAAAVFVAAESWQEHAARISRRTIAKSGQLLRDLFRLRPNRRGDVIVTRSSSLHIPAYGRQ